MPFRAFEVATGGFGGAGDSLTITKPTAPTDDILIASISGANGSQAAAITPPTGWTKIDDASGTVQVSSDFHTLQRFWKRVTASEPTSYAFSYDRGSWKQGWIASFSGGITSGNPIVAGSFNPSTTNGSTITALGITLADASTDTLFLGSNYNNTFATSPANTPPSGFTQRIQDNNQYLATASLGSGATGNKTLTLAASDRWSGALIGIKPAASGPTNISGTSNGLASASGSISMLLSGSSQGTATTGTPTANMLLGGTSQGTATNSGNAWMALSGSASGTATTTGIPATLHPVSGSAQGTATTSGDASTSNYLDVSGSSSGIATTQASALMLLSGSAQGTGTGSGTLVVPLSVSGSSSGLATTTGDILQYLNVSGSSQGSATNSATAATLHTVSGISNGIAQTYGSFESYINLNGNSSGVASVSGSLAQWVDVSGSVFGASSGSATAQILIALSGQSGAVALVSGSLAQAIPLSGFAQGTSNGSGILGSTISRAYAAAYFNETAYAAAYFNEAAWANAYVQEDDLIYVGSRVRIWGEWRKSTDPAADPDASDPLADPTGVTFRVFKPDGTIENRVWGTDTGIERDSLGKWYAEYVPTMAGEHRAAMIGSGNAEQVAVTRFYANPV